MRTARPLNRTAPIVAIGAVAALTLAGCTSSGSPKEGDGSSSLKVVATTTQLTDFAKQVGGDDIELTGLLKAGASAHHFDPSADDLLKLGEADVLVVNGAGLETFIDSAVDSSGFDGEIITAADGIDLAEAKEITLESGGGEEEHEHAEEEHAEEEGEEHDHDHAEEEHAEDEHASEADAETEGETHEDEGEEHDHEAEGEEEHDHDHGDLNPHIWTSPKNAEGMVSEIAKGFGKADADHESDYTENADAYIEKLKALDEWDATQFDRVPQEERVLVSGHDSLTYYLHDYGITYAGAILPSFEDNAEPSAAEIDELVAKIKENHVKAIFVESSMSPKLAETVAKEADVEVVDSEALYADSLGAKGSGAETYLDATVHNTQTILGAWGAEVDEVPDTLKG